MQSDTKVPDPLPRGLTVPAVAVVMLVLTGAVWGVGLFLLGRQSAPMVEVPDAQGIAHLAALNRIDQAIVRGDPADILAQLRNVTLAEGPIGQTALELRRARLTALAVEQAAKAEAASPAAVLRRLEANLWMDDPTRVGESSRLPVVVADAPRVEKTTVESGEPAKREPVKPAATQATPLPAPPSPTPPSPSLAELTYAGEAFVPDARIIHPIILKRAYALHPRHGLLRSDDGGVTWRSGLAPLQRLKGWQLSFTTGDRPLLYMGGILPGRPSWLFNDTEDAFFP